jgi:hypothetical protein
VNLEGLSDWARLPVYVDVMKTARVWGSATDPWIATSAVDALGWPTGDAGVVAALRTVDVGDEANPYQYLAAGTYKLRFTGKATVAPVASPGVSVTNYIYDLATNRSTADVVVGATSTQLMLGFTGTVGGVRDVSLIRPGYADTQTFTNEFLQAVAPFGVLRFMDFLATNSNPTRTWAERTTPASATQASSKGGAYEHAIQMGNDLGKDIWINIPAGADDTYVRSLATLLNQSLAPGRVAYVEYSNELWNFTFPQTGDNVNAAVAEAIAGDTTLTNGTLCTQAMFDATAGDCNKYWAGYYRVGKRIASISRIFSEVMGASAFNTRFRPVYATQWANSGIGEQVLKNMAKYRGAPNTLIHGIAGAPYYTLPQSVYTSTTLTVDQIVTGLQTSVDVDFAPYFTTGIYVNGVFSRGTPYDGGNYRQPTQKALADYYGIRSLAYEGGEDLGQSDASTLAKMQANKDLRMGNTVNSELTQWYGCGNDLFMYFSLASTWGKWGYWGLTNDPANLSLPKYVAAKTVAQTARTSFTTCR